MASKTTPQGEPQSGDFRTDLTNRIIVLIEDGVAPWQKPWNPSQAAGALELPHNGVSGRPYHGGNALWLLTRAGFEGYDDPRWCTFKQAMDKGWHIKKGSKATTVEYWQFDKEEKSVNPDTGRVETRTVKLDAPRVFYARVFNAKQIEGIPPFEPKARADWNPIEDAERALTNSGAKILHDQSDRAFYSLTRDAIHLPPRSAFQSPPDYYEVALHELGHWTGHPTRMGRDLSGTFGSEAYAKEELRAQMASLFISTELGIPFNPERHAAYQASWVKALRDDKHEIFRAARDAEEIMHYVIGLAREREKTLDHDSTRSSDRSAWNPAHDETTGREVAAMEAPTDDRFGEGENSTQETGRILCLGQTVDRVRYEMSLESEKLVPTIERANLTLFHGRKEVAVLEDLSRDDVEKALGPGQSHEIYASFSRCSR